MKKIKIVINCENAAFRNNGNFEVVRILEQITRKLDEYSARDENLLDINGNSVGYVEIT